MNTEDCAIDEEAKRPSSCHRTDAVEIYAIHSVKVSISPLVPDVFLSDFILDMDRATQWTRTALLDW